MVDRIEFSPLGGVDPRQLFAQREARQALLNSLVTEAPRIGASESRPAPEAPQRQERPEQDDARRTPRDEAARNAANLPGAPQEGNAALGPNQNTGEPTGPADVALERSLGPEVQLPVPGTGQAGAPLFGGGGFGPAGPSSPLVRDIAPLGETGGGEDVPGPRPLGGAQPGAGPAAPELRAPEPPLSGPGGPGSAADPQGGGEPRGSVVDVLV
ncbi:MAG: hypothetical protein HYZ11_04405 [Candidatus Tectomicrobia bacterium]|uniref:Uncharacterized protein n=1 Tax=Tectimicrobiota bacterium TaxID=2528274 RepID=A0A932HYL1_UNCTE|nr:hypothetical protein [Candidatus Tectomicrobia bacterium]